jgi:hypothetical protein
MSHEFVVQDAEDGGVEAGPIPDDTMANATLIGTEIKEQTFPGESEPTPRMKWKFRIDDDAYLDRYVWGTTGVKIVNHPQCKIYNWAQAVLDITPLPLNYGFDQPDLWQRRCRVLIGAREGKDKKTGDPRVFNYVEDVLPAGPVTDPDSEPF